jgi:hypothetical protein
MATLIHVNLRARDPGFTNCSQFAVDSLQRHQSLIERG